MPRSKPVILETRSFDNQKAATTFFKSMLNRYRPKQIVSDEDAADLAALLKRHAEYEEKVGVGIDHFEVMRAAFWHAVLSYSARGRHRGGFLLSALYRGRPGRMIGQFRSDTARA